MIQSDMRSWAKKELAKISGVLHTYTHAQMILIYAVILLIEKYFPKTGNHWLGGLRRLRPVMEEEVAKEDRLVQTDVAFREKIRPRGRNET